MSLRARNLAALSGARIDVLVVGGGINGAVSAAALAGRGASVGLVDRGDFAGLTSQASSNLAWGGFKYLENYEFGLVRKLCRSRNRLLDAYPANIREARFLASLDHSSPYPPWLAGLGAVAYWVIGSFATRRPRVLRAQSIEAREPSVDTSSVRGGIEYSDAIFVDNDARFVFSFVRNAMDSGAIAANYCELVAAHHQADGWSARLCDRQSGEEHSLECRVIVNAAGPFADALNQELGAATDHTIVFSKGIHLVVPRLTDSGRVLAFFDDTQRLFYVIPMGHRSVIGTTDTRVAEPVTEVSEEDRTFLLDQINARLDLPRPLGADDVIAERCGVRPLVVQRGSGDTADQDWTSLSRKHEIETDRQVVSVLGGKLTDCLNVGEEVAAEVERLGVTLETDHGQWFGEPPAQAREEFFAAARWAGLDDLPSGPGFERLSDRLWRRYGAHAFDLLGAIRAEPAMGERIMAEADYLRAELHHAAQHEMVTRLDDFLRRRSKIAQVVPHVEVASSAGLAEACRILFGDDADAELDRWRRATAAAERR